MGFGKRGFKMRTFLRATCMQILLTVRQGILFALMYSSRRLLISYSISDVKSVFDKRMNTPYLHKGHW